MENRTILVGDVLEKIKEIPDETVDCVITSPPYWGLRDYGTKGQWGLEVDFHDYLNKLSSLMNELKRVLKPTGSVWINIGDTYGTVSGNYEQQAKEEKKYKGMKENLSGEYPSQKQMKSKLQSKSRVGIPERFYINSIDQGWIARNHIPWIKPNAMPSSVKDRFTNKWESIFFFTKNQKYYFNLDAVREKPVTELPKPREIKKIVDLFGEQTTFDPERTGRKGNNADLGNRNFMGIKEKYAEEPDSNVARLHRQREGNPNKQDQVIDPKTGKPKQTYSGFNERWKNGTKGYTQFFDRVQNLRDQGVPHDNPLGHPNGKNPGDIFVINTKPFVEAHFATFPLDLPLRILSCACPQNGTVLDPFLGSGTVGVAAEKLGINWIGIELKQEYVDKIILKRLDKHKNERLEQFVQ